VEVQGSGFRVGKHSYCTTVFVGGLVGASVAQICNLPYRRIVFGHPLASSEVWEKLARVADRKSAIRRSAGQPQSKHNFRDRKIKDRKIFWKKPFALAREIVAGGNDFE
jgi:hypothetical protein